MFGRRPVRRGGPGLVGTMARTAVIAGTAQATANAVNSRAEHKQHAKVAAAEQQNSVIELQQQVEALQAQETQAVVTPPAPTPAAAPQDEQIAKLTQLGELHSAGILTDDEFAAAKARILS